jgi:hypothetical protein
MSRRLQENIVALVILGVFVAAIVASLDYSPRARLVPIPIAALGILFIVGQIVLQNLRSEDSLHIDLLDFLTKQGDKTDPALAAAAAAPPAAGPKRGPTAASELQALGIVALLVAIFLVLGPIPAMFVFTAGYFIVSRHHSVWKGIAYAAFWTLLVYLVFTTGLKVQLDRNLLGIRFDTIGKWVVQLFT